MKWGAVPKLFSTVSAPRPLLRSLTPPCTAHCPSLSPYESIKGKFLHIGCIPIIGKVRKKALMETIMFKYFMINTRLHDGEWSGSQLPSHFNWEDLGHFYDWKNLSPLDLSSCLSQIRGIVQRWYLRSCSALKYSMLHFTYYSVESKIPALVVRKAKAGWGKWVPRTESIRRRPLSDADPVLA